MPYLFIQSGKWQLIEVREGKGCIDLALEMYLSLATVLLLSVGRAAEETTPPPPLLSVGSIAVEPAKVGHATLEKV